MKRQVLNSKGESIGEIDLLDSVFGIEPNTDVLHEYIVNYLANQRSGTKSALTRAEVSGGGIKPWRQKGTGHARQGSIRAPQWRHGGIVFAPKPRDFHKTMNKKMKNLAIRSVLSLKAMNNDLLVLEDFSMDSFRTKTLLELMKSLKVQKPVLVLPESNKFIVKSASNIKGLKILSSNSLNSYDIFYHKNLVIFSSAIPKICEIFAPKGKNSDKVVA